MEPDKPKEKAVKKKKLTLIRIFLVLAALGTAEAQAQERGKIYDSPDSVAVYGSARHKLEFIYQQALAISDLNCIGEDSTLISTLTAELIIDSSGKVEHAEIPKPKMD